MSSNIFSFNIVFLICSGKIPSLQFRSFIALKILSGFFNNSQFLEKKKDKFSFHRIQKKFPEKDKIISEIKYSLSIFFS